MYNILSEYRYVFESLDELIQFADKRGLTLNKNKRYPRLLDKNGTVKEHVRIYYQDGKKYYLVG